MNDKDFEELAHANPWAQNDEFLNALREKPERELLVNDLKTFDENVLSGLSVPAPENLKQKLLDIPEQDNTEETEADALESDKVLRPSFWQWKKAGPLAASFLLVGLLGFSLLSPSAEEFLTNEVIAHVYHEIGALDWELDIDMPEVNEHFSALGGSFETKGDIASLDVDAVMDCWVAKENSLHMIVKGNVGPVTVMVVPNKPVGESFAIHDKRFEGLVSPTEGGNLIVMGEKEEEIVMYQDLFIANLNW